MIFIDFIYKHIKMENKTIKYNNNMFDYYISLIFIQKKNYLI